MGLENCGITLEPKVKNRKVINVDMGFLFWPSLDYIVKGRTLPAYDLFKLTYVMD